jgi:hypothetical protein
MTTKIYLTALISLSIGVSSTTKVFAQSDNRRTTEKTYRKKYYKEGERSHRREDYVIPADRRRIENSEEATEPEEKKPVHVTPRNARENMGHVDRTERNDLQNAHETERNATEHADAYRSDEARSRKDMRRRARKDKWIRDAEQKEEQNSK